MYLDRLPLDPRGSGFVHGLTYSVDVLRISVYINYVLVLCVCMSVCLRPGLGNWGRISTPPVGSFSVCVCVRACLESNLNQTRTLVLLYTLSVALGKHLKLSEPQFFHQKNGTKVDYVGALLHPLSPHSSCACFFQPQGCLGSPPLRPEMPRAGIPGSNPPPVTCRTWRINILFPHL